MARHVFVAFWAHRRPALRVSEAIPTKGLSGELRRTSGAFPPIPHARAPQTDTRPCVEVGPRAGHPHFFVEPLPAISPAEPSGHLATASLAERSSDPLASACWFAFGGFALA